MILKRLELQGAKGIKYGLGLDYIDIDFTRLQPGLVAIVGRNGSGKTTILENLTPFRSFFSRSGTMQQHFFHPDSFRKLTFQVGDDEYKSEIFITPEKDKVTATLYRNDKPIATKPRGYDVEINKLFLGKGLFEQSLFFGQDTDRITDLRAGEAKEFMISLLRLDKAQEISKRSGLHAKEVLAEYQTQADRIEELKDQISKREHVETVLKESQEHQEDAKKQIEEKQLLLDGVKASLVKKEHVDALVKDKEQGTKDREGWEEGIKLQEVKLGDVKQINDQVKIKSHIGELDQMLKVIPTTQDDVNLHKELNKKLVTLNERKSVGAERLGDLNAEISNIKAHKLVEKGLIETKLARVQTKLKDARRASEKIKGVPCEDETGRECDLLTDAFKSHDSIEALEQEQLLLESSLEALSEKYDTSKLEPRRDKAKKLVEKITLEIEGVDQSLEPLENVETDWSKKQEIEKHITEEKARLEKCDALVEEAEKTCKEFLELAHKEISKIESKLKEIQTELDKYEEVDFDVLVKTQSTLEEDLLELRNSQASLLLTIGKATNRLTDIELREVHLRKLRRQTKVKMQHHGEWILIEKAYGRNGIQSFEIKKALPAIVKMMNELLIGDLGQKFSLNFRMKRLGGSGQLIDTFDPLVARYDESEIIEKEVPLSNLSRGERILVFVAMSEAVGVYLRNSIGLDLRTAFVDEADGPLDPANRADYLKTRQHVHTICSLHHTFIISQSPDIYDKIPQKLRLEKNNIEVVI